MRQLLLALGAAICIGGSISGCETAPKASDRADVVSRSHTTEQWFESRVPGLRSQINSSAGYIVFPDVAEAGIIVGGTHGRGIVCKANGQQIGWAEINTANFGLQAGVQGFRMLMVIQSDEEMKKFQAGKWNGSATSVAVIGESGVGGVAPFQEGVAVYQGANRGLMAGINVGLNNISYQPL